MKTTIEQHNEEATLFDSILFDEFLMSLGADDNDTFGIDTTSSTLSSATQQQSQLTKSNSLRSLRDSFTIEPFNIFSAGIETDERGHACEQSINSESLQITASAEKLNAFSTCATPTPSTTAADIPSPTEEMQSLQQSALLCLAGQVGTRAAASCCSRKSQTLPPDFTPSNYDVICLGRGKSAASHPGNRRFQITIQLYHDRYASCKSKFEKSVIVSEIVDSVRENSQMGGFVKRDSKTGAWFEVGDSVAREKVGQALRESLRSQSSRAIKAKANRTKECMPSHT